MGLQGIDQFGCRGNTIKVHSGVYVDLDEPKPETIDLESIASALSKMCRFGGQCPRFYSVAEHCIKAHFLANLDGCTTDELRAILMHDAAEAYIGDVVKPLKQLLPDYVRIEERIEVAISERFGIDFAAHHDVIKRYDRAMLKAEKTQMWPNDSEKWQGFSEIPDRAVCLEFWEPDYAETLFSTAAGCLGII